MYHKKTAIFQKERIVSFHFHYFSGLTFIYVSFLGCSALFRSKSFLCFWFGRQRNLHLTPGTFPLLVACCSNTWRCSAGYKEGSRSLESPLIVRWAMKKNPSCLGYIGDESYPVIWGLFLLYRCVFAIAFLSLWLERVLLAWFVLGRSFLKEAPEEEKAECWHLASICSNTDHGQNSAGFETTSACWRSFL